MTATSEFDIELPTEATDIVLINPATMGIFGKPKSGKTSAVLDLPDCLTIELEPRGADFKKGKVLKIPSELDPFKSVAWLRAVIKKIKADRRPYKYVAIDTLTMVDFWSNWMGTEKYMNTTQGKEWNRYNKKDDPNDPTLWGKKIPYTSERYELINDQDGGYGYRWSRAALVELYKEMSTLGSVCTIFIMHVVENKTTKTLNGSMEITERGIALTGLLKEIIARDLDAIGYVYHQDGKTMISFQNNEERVGGMRGSSHLRGYNDELKWDKIFT